MEERTIIIEILSLIRYLDTLGEYDYFKGELTFDKLRLILYNSKEYIKYRLEKEEKFNPTYKNIPQYNSTFLRQPATLIGREFNFYSGKEFSIPEFNMYINQLTIKKGILATVYANQYLENNDKLTPNLTLFSYYRKHSKIPIFAHDWDEKKTTRNIHKGVNYFNEYL